jgi:hypothetical protein
MKSSIAILLLALLFVGCQEDATTNITTGSYGTPMTALVSSDRASKFTDFNASDFIYNECGRDGGYAIVTGYDKNGDKFLSVKYEYDEVDKNATQAICNGTDGLDGDDGIDTLVGQIALEEFGAVKQVEFETILYQTCGFDISEENGTLYGGVVLSVGKDIDSDGELDIDEVQKFTALCGSRNLYIDFQENKEGATLTIVNGDANAESVTIKHGQSPEVYDADLNGTGCVTIIDVDDVNHTVCDGTSVSVIKILEGNQTHCEGVGGMYIIDEPNDTSYSICNGKSVSDVQMDIKVSSNGGLYLSSSKAGDLNESAPTVQLPEIPDRETTVVEEIDAGDLCRYGGLRIHSFMDTNENGTYDSGTDGAEIVTTVCSYGEPDQTLTVTVGTPNDNSIPFTFSEPMNPTTVNESSVILQCEGNFVMGYISYSFSSAEVRVFNFVADRTWADYPADFDTSCELLIRKEVEALDGTQMSSNITKAGLNISED